MHHRLKKLSNVWGQMLVVPVSLLNIVFLRNNSELCTETRKYSNSRFPRNCTSVPRQTLSVPIRYPSNGPAAKVPLVVADGGSSQLDGRQSLSVLFAQGSMSFCNRCFKWGYTKVASPIASFPASRQRTCTPRWSPFRSSHSSAPFCLLRDHTGLERNAPGGAEATNRALFPPPSIFLT